MFLLSFTLSFPFASLTNSTRIIVDIRTFIVCEYVHIICETVVSSFLAICLWENDEISDKGHL